MGWRDLTGSADGWRVECSLRQEMTAPCAELSVLACQRGRSCCSKAQHGKKASTTNLNLDGCY
eukprot:scaffold67574_cov21-Tisochrysis_lutea.AAC.1